ncbi:YfcC family protein [Brevibacillus invocatus]|uniref:YfcC family protein n=1 Tax=Brevibacillus invocatus TaxID=173959 RepID=UPI00203A7613|nr:Na+/H+ antiporter NhaC family protein [Brevibacillus invocatus]MCM3079362.1 AbgT family transporter [Brevibacillus invocatus]MCM3429458.1 AbgT family transporter [Brevibacillus invocatus]
MSAPHSSSSANRVPAKKRFNMPHTYAILFIMIVLAALLSYILPAGEFERIQDPESGKTIVVSNSYHQVESSPVSFFDMFKSIPTGMQKGAQIIFYIFIVSGVFGIIRSTGAIEAGINKGVRHLAGREILMIPASMLLFSIGGFAMGMAEETIIFVPIGIALARAMGFDAVTGTAMVTLGAASGFIGGMLNPFTVGIAQSLAQIPLFSGLAFRSVVYVFVLGFAIWYVMRYAYKVKADPTQSVIHDLEYASIQDEREEVAISVLNTRHLIVFLVIAGGLAFNVYGVFQHGWFLLELTASFLVMGLIAGFVGGLSINKVFDSFVSGAKAVTYGALIVGFARAITVVLEDGKIIDTIVNSLTAAISSLPDTVNVVAMFLIQSLINLFIPSGSGQAAATMPIMVPISDLLGIQRQVAVLAYQYGDAISNSIIPTSSALMGYLAVAGIPYEKWVKFVWKLILGWTLIACIALIVAVLIGLT